MSEERRKKLIRERLALAEIGIPTFLAYGVKSDARCECGKRNCKRPGKHPRESGRDRGATLDPARIRRETESGFANVGLHCGQANLVVLDIDPRNAGFATIAELEDELGPLDSAVVTETGGGGEHRYFRATPGVSYPASLGPGVDVLSGSKYPIIPPSIHYSGQPYAWREGCDPISAAFLLTQLRDSVLDRFCKQEDEEDDLPLRAIPVEESEAETARLRSALQAISADCPRDEWRDHVFAINATGWQCAEELAREWSQSAPHRFSESAFEELWKSADPSKPGGRTIGSIYHAAKANGWSDPRAANGFATLGDIDNGRRFASRFRGKLIFERASKVWRQYRGGIWRACDRGEHVAAAKEIADTILKEAGERLAANPTDANRAAHNQALRVHRSAQRVNATIDMAAAEPGMSVPDASYFDANPYLLGVSGGAIDLRTGASLPPSPDHRISKCIGVSYDPEAHCPKFEQFLKEIMASDEEVGFLQRFAGYTLTGSVDEEVLLFMQGQGANGKSVLANVLAAIFGDYAVTVGSELLAITKHESEVARLKVRLRGARMALVNEVGQSDTFNDQRVKEIVSREAISARLLYGEAFDFVPTHKLWVRGNHRPAVLDSGDGMWRRLLLLPFLRQFTVHERVPDLERRLIAEEGSGILNWCIAGTLEWRKRRLDIPASISGETRRYREETDVLAEWIEAECRTGAELRCRIPTIYESYRSYFQNVGMTPKSQPAFTRMMGARGYCRRSSNGKSYLEGVDIDL